MDIWSYLLNRLKAIPLGIYAAAGAALALLGLYLRGRRLEGELAHARLLAEVSSAAAATAKNEGEAQVHLATADMHAVRAEALREHVVTVRAASGVEQQRLAALPPSEVTSEFLKLAQRKGMH